MLCLTTQKHAVLIRIAGFPVHALVQLSACLCLIAPSLFGHAAIRDTSQNAEPQTITSVASIRHLTRAQAEQHYPVHLRGVVTYFDTADPTLFLQDATGGIWVNWNSTKPLVSTGDVLDLTGHAAQPGFAPQVDDPQWKVVGRSALPVAHPTTFYKMASSVEDSQRVKIDGVVRQVVRLHRSAHSPLLWLDIAVTGGRVHAQVPWSEAPIPPDLLDAHISLTGVCQAEFTGKYQLVGISIVVASLDGITILDVAHGNLSALPPVPIGDLQRYGAVNSLETRLKVSGVVTAVLPRRGVYIRDRSGAVYVDTRQDDVLSPGDLVEVSGFSDISQGQIKIEDAALRRLGSTPSPLPLPASIDLALQGRYESELIELEGKVVEHSLFRRTQAFLVQQKGTIFSVSSTSPNGLGNFPGQGSTVRITGISVTESDVTTGRITGLRLIARSPSDIVVLSSGPWWTVPRVLLLVAILGSGAVLALLWGLILRRRVASQTELIRATVESTADGILVVDHNKKAVLWNNKFKELWRLPDELLSTKMDRELLLQYVLAQLVNPKEFLERVEYLYSARNLKSDDRIECKDGRVFERHAEPQIVAGRNVGLVWGFRDVTDRAHAEAALRLRNKQQAAVAELGQFALTETNLELVVEKAGCLIANVFRVHDCRIVQDVLPSSSLEAALNEAYVPIAGMNKDWGYIFVAREEACVFTKDDQFFLHQLANVLASAAARRLIDLELEASRDAAHAGSQAKSEFLAMMSHEIRTPMNGVIGMTSVLGQTNLSDQQKDCVAAIQHSGEVLLTLISDILDFSKIEAGKLELESTAFSLRQKVSEVMQIAGELARQKGLHSSLEWDPSLPSQVIGDPVRIRQILSNLLFNAIKFTHQGGVTLRVRRKNETIPALLHLCCEIVDTGIGIAPEAATKLFDSFSQADRSTTRKYGGTGLGLAISKRLVELMGGTIGVASELGRGSCFWFELPLPVAQSLSDAPPESNFNPAEPRQELAENRLEILVAEDNLINRKVLVHMLKRNNFQVDVAGDGEEAIRAAREKKYDLILMDCQMPGVDGFEASRLIRAQRGLNSQTPIIAVTANAFADDRSRCLEAGMNDHISKPISREQLEASITRWTAVPSLIAV